MAAASAISDVDLEVDAGVSEAGAKAWAQDLTELGPDYFLSLNRYLFLAHKPS